MIEDDLRSIIADAVDVPAYSRFIPRELPECIIIQYNGGQPIKAGIRKSREIVTLLSVSPDRYRAAARLRKIRDALITGLPAEVAGSFYYTATALADGGLQRKTAAGPVFIEYVDLEVLAAL